MSRHAKSSSFIRSSIATASAVTLSAGTMIAFAPASQAATCDDGSVAGVTATTIGGVCQLQFIPVDINTDGDYADTGERSWGFTVPAGVTKVSALVIGAGGASASATAHGLDYAAGGGGDVVYVDDIGSGPFTLLAGFGGYSDHDDAYSSIASSGSDGGYNAAIATPTDGGDPPTATGERYPVGGASPNYPGGTITTPNGSEVPFSEQASGAGFLAGGLFNSGALAGALLGGAGVNVQHFSEDTTLWASQNTTIFGAGGSVLASGGTLPTLSTIDGTGQGGSVINQEPGGGTQRGAHGSIILRYEISTSYTVSFNTNGGTGTMSDQSDSSSTTLTSNSLSRDGFTFDGWNTSPDGSGTDYADGATYAFGADLTLYAQWTTSSPLLTCDINQGALEFNRAVESGALTTEIAQAEGDDSNNIGAPGSANDYFHYFDIATACGTQIDARVTVTTVENLSGLDEVDRASDSTGKNPWINTGIESNTAADSYVELQIEFLTGLTYEAESGTPVTLQDFAVSTYDIDDYQYLESNEFDRYYLSTNTILEAVPTSNGFTRIAELNGVSTSSDTDQQTKSRATLEYDAADTVTIRLGQVPVNSGETAGYYVDFGPGLSWSGVQGGSIVNPSSTPPAPTPYTGPLPVKLDTVCVPSSGGNATLSGQRLSGITSATVDGKAVTVSGVTATSVKLAFPALQAGTYDVTYTSNSGTVTHQDSLRVCATGSTETPTETEVDPGATPERFYVYKRFSNYRGDLGGVVNTDRAAITAFVNANPGLTYVTCLGSTSGTPAIASDEALALARAKNACSIVEELVPGVTTRLATITGAGKGQFFRAVTLFGRGIN